MEQAILFVDDEPHVLAGLKRQLRNRYVLETAEGTEAALSLFEEGRRFAIVVSDMRMPGMDGVELLKRVRSVDPKAIRMVLTGQADLNATVGAVNIGNIFRFLTKPCPTEDMCAALDAGLDQYRLVETERQLLEDTLQGSVGLLVDILAMVAPSTFSRSGRVQRVMGQLVQLLGAESTWELELAGKLSLIGYLSVPHDVLEKQRTGQILDEDEVGLLAEHPVHARGLLGKIPRLENVAEIVGAQARLPDPDSLPSAVTDWPVATLGAQALAAAVAFDERLSAGGDALSAYRAVHEAGCVHPKVVAALARVRVHEDAAVRLIGASELHAGMVLDEDVRTTDDHLLLSHGYEVTEPIILRLRSHASRGVLVEPFRVRVDASEAAEGREATPVDSLVGG